VLLDAPGMVDALKEVLDAPPPPPAAPGGAPPGDGGAAAACYAARPKALRLLRQLACSSKAAARLLQESGAVRFALEHLLRSLGGGGAAAAADARQLGALTESLRLWRCFAQHGFFLLLLDDAYPTLCPHLAPPLPAHAAAAALAGQPMTLLPGELRGWCVAREAFSTAAQLCWHAARCVCVCLCVLGGGGWRRGRGAFMGVGGWATLTPPRAACPPACCLREVQLSRHDVLLATRSAGPILPHHKYTHPGPPLAGATPRRRRSARSAPPQWHPAPCPGWRGCRCASWCRQASTAAPSCHARRAATA
jgi:hypothetical protein